MREEQLAAGVTSGADADDAVVGREEELEQLSLFARPDAATPALLVIEGDAGIGKTTLWRAGVRELEASGVRVLTSTPAASEASFSLSALGDLLEPVYPLVRTELPAPQRHALDVALALESPGDPTPENERLLCMATLAALRALTALGPVAIAVDDSQWLDRESALVLEYALRRLRTEPVRCLLACRLEPRSALDRTRLGTLQVQRIAVGPLSLGATQRLLLHQLGRTYPRAVISRVVETSGGNPFYALELAHGIERTGDGASTDPPALSETLDALIAARLDGVGEAGRRLLGSLSLVPEASIRLLEALGALQGLDEAVGAGLVRVQAGVASFEHPLLAAGAQARLGPEERRRLHLALAGALEDPIDRAWHLAQGTVAPSEHAAAEIAAAALLAAGRGRSAVAAELMAEACRATPAGDPDRRLERRSLEARLLAQSGSFERAAAVVDDVLHALPPAGDARAEALCLRARVTTGDVAHRRRLLLEALDASADPAIAATAYALLVRNLLYSGDLPAALRAAHDGEVQARATGEPLRVAAALTTRGLMEIWGTGAASPDVIAQATELIASGASLPTETYSNPHTLLGARALYRYELDEARSAYAAASAAAESAGDVDSVETFWWGLAQLEVRAGRYAVARDYVERLAESEELDGRRPLSLTWIEGVLATYDGRVEEARASLEETLAGAEGDGNWFFVAYARSALGFLELTLDRPEAALETLEPVLATSFVAEGDPGQTGILPIAAEALTRSGSLDRAATLIATLEERGRALEHAWCLACAARCRGHLLAVQGDLDGALARLAEALVHQEGVPAPFEQARTQLVLGWVQRRARLRRAARETLEAARTTFETLDTPLWAAKAAAELARVSGRAPSRGALTPHELRIATLVGEGRTNKEVAAELFVTDRTVESALTQIYRKLGVRSRTELARRLPEHD